VFGAPDRENRGSESHQLADHLPVRRIREAQQWCLSLSDDSRDGHRLRYGDLRPGGPRSHRRRLCSFASCGHDAWGNPQGTGNLGTGVCSQTTSLIDATLAAAVATCQSLRYAGYSYDRESGLYHLSARSYDPQTRQFSTKDDAAKADGEESVYQYFSGDPIGQTDATGEGATKIEFPVNTVTDLSRNDWVGYYYRIVRRNAGTSSGFLVVGNILPRISGCLW
jgi:RHS repeat-associated protein